MIVLKRITSAGKSTVACARRGCNGVTCYIQPKCAKQPISAEKLRFFDFEADSTHGGYHIPNYATVGETFNVYHNNALSIIDQLCEGECCEANEGVILPHNAKGYDAQFIKESLIRRGIRFDFLPNGHKIMELKIQALKIRIIDSANFIQASLAAFPKVFGSDLAGLSWMRFCGNFQSWIQTNGSLAGLSWIGFLWQDYLGFLRQDSLGFFDRVSWVSSPG